MKKIMFNDKYGLTQAVLEGRKTMTRRIIPQLLNTKEPDLSEWGIDDKGKATLCIYENGKPTTDIYPMYQPGEVVAVAQKYIDLKDCDAFYEALYKSDPYMPLECIKGEKGAYNKMFVKAAWMPHQISINNIKVERLQDISDKDCLREGITMMTEGKIEIGNAYGWDTKIDALRRDSFFTPREAFAVLIDKVSGKGTWQRNPWVFVYEFELLNS